MDFIDVKVGVFSSMYHERLSGYKKEKYMLLTDDGFYQKQIYSLLPKYQIHIISQKLLLNVL